MVTITGCTITSNTAKFDFTIASGTSISSVVFKAQNFVNPSTTASISGVSAGYYSSSGILLESYINYAFAGLTPQLMTVSPTLTPSSTVIGATGKITIAFTTVNPIQTSGMIMIVFPQYSSSTTSFITTSTPSCVGIVTL
jgi:hypothetical protein